LKILGFEIRRASEKKERNIGGIPVPVGRRSEAPDSFGSLMGMANGFLSCVDPKVPYNFLEIISKLCLTNPDFSQAVDNVVSLGNNGHQLLINADSARRIDKALKRLNKLADRIMIENLINRLFRQAAIYGALSHEWIVNKSLTEMQTYAMVPVRDIRFQYDKEQSRYVSRQLSSKGDLIELNENTYTYSALEQDENSPYGIPPFVAALRHAMVQIDVTDNIAFVIKKLGLLGVFDVVMKQPPAQEGESNDDFINRITSELNSLANNLIENYRNGMMAHYDNMELNHTAVSTDMRGVKDLNQMIEEQVMSGLRQDPAMLGRAYSTTETYGEVVYTKMVNSLDNVRRHVKFVIEKGYELDLLMGGIIISSLAMDFSGNSSFKPKEQAETSQIATDTAISRMDAGLISPDQAAQEIGYEKAYSQGLPSDSGSESFGNQLSVKFVYKGGRYKLSRESLVVMNSDAIIRDSLADDVGAVQLASEKGIERRRLRWVDSYFKQIKGLDDKARGKVLERVAEKLGNKEFSTEGPDEFANDVFEFVSTKFPDALADQGLKDKVNRRIYDTYFYYRVRDKIVDVKRIPSLLKLPDKRAVKFLKGLDDFYFSKYLQNDSAKKPMLKFLKKEYLEGGYTNINGFIKRYGTNFGNISKSQIQRIVDTSVSRIRNWGHIRQMSEFKTQYFEIVEVLDRITCPICLEMDGKIFPVGKADEKVQNLSELSAEDFNEKVYKNAPAKTQEEWIEYAKAKSGEEMIADNIVGPPFHSRCRGRQVAK